MSTDKELVGRVRDLFIYRKLSDADIAAELGIDTATVKAILAMLGKFSLLAPPLSYHPRKGW